EDGTGSRPAITLTGTSLARARSTPTTELNMGSVAFAVECAPGGNDDGGSTSIGVASTGTTVATSRSFEMRRSAVSSYARGGPAGGLSLSSATGLGAAASTLMPARGPPALT